MHYYNFNIPDWSLGTSHLSPVEEAVYLRLVNLYYDTESPIPNDYSHAIRKLRLSEYSDIVAQILGEFFSKTENGFVHGKCETIIKEYRKKTKINRANGARGGRPSNGAASSITQSVPSRFILETQTEPRHNPDITLTNNQEPITNNQEPITNKTSSSSKEPSEYLVDQKLINRQEDKISYSKIKMLWDEILGDSNGTIRAITDQRKKHIRARVAEDAKRKDFDWWRKYFEWILESEFLTGKQKSENGKTWKADFDWVINQANMIKIIEGKYHHE